MELTDEQRDIAEQPGDARLLVTAGAGTGKTFTLIRRLSALIEDEGLGADEVLVLSFSRAAVREVRDRLAVYGENAQHVEVRTFDSYATQLLSEITPEGTWQHSSYDQRIREATSLLRDDDQAGDFAADIRHLVVDEVQDLVGVRAELVKVLLERISGGFTLLGDPAQGIYGFQLDDPKDRIRGAAALYSWVRARFGKNLIEKELTENFRARHDEARVALAVGSELGQENADYAGIQRRLRTGLLDSMPLGALEDAVPLLTELATPTALLCRTNGEALLVSRELHRSGVAHRLQRSAQDRVIPKWMAELFRRLDSRAGQNDVAAVLAENGAEADEIWPLLKRMDTNRRSRSLNLSDVRNHLARGDVPDELTRQHPATLVVSTIHRVKGLEFDQVIVVDPGEAGEDPVEQAEKARTLYVAMTRPRDLLLHIRPVNTLQHGRLRKFSCGRWGEAGFGKYRNARFSIEMQAEDIHAENPAGSIGFTADPLTTQLYLATKVASGDLVSLVQASSSTNDGPPSYIVEHDGTPVGVTSAAFSQVLKQILPGRDRHEWPLSINDLYVDCVETVVGSDAAGQNSGLGWSGVWLRPRIAGLGRFEWPPRERK
ncbi:UvrD-helicase domain-containing protein [Streptosporangium sp. NBC_01810]|uniref:UvrD-helicase domain-containing protein n=1 Tax=Streptosporangium sp. NBC_01810 TaxID=2975951 RepID=UPI002DD814EA|nr:UvrD-helicase domain-containing protein [Streptosporangium sp. NBC_01810]WSA25904.1 UvrD-helicase domain-containing protein [Streptosporangium sp. NBC_01810]